MPSGRVGPLTRERRRELTRTALIEAAAELFARKGFHATSLEEIAQAAGFTRGAIYKNFKSKEEILISVVDWTIERQLVAYADALENADASTADRVLAAVEVWTRVFQRDADLALLELELRLHALRNEEFRPRLAEWERHQLSRVARFIAEQSRASGLTLTVPPEDLAAIALAGVEGLSQAASVQGLTAERSNRLVELLFRMLSTVLVEKPADRKPPAGSKRKA